MNFEQIIYWNKSNRQTQPRSSVHFPNPYIINLGTSVSKCHRFRRMDGSGCECVCACVELAEELSKYLVDEVFRHKLCRFVPLRPWPEKEAVGVRGKGSEGKGEWGVDFPPRGTVYDVLPRKDGSCIKQRSCSPMTWVCVCVFVISETIIIF